MERILLMKNAHTHHSNSGIIYVLHNRNLRFAVNGKQLKCTNFNHSYHTVVSYVHRLVENNVQQYTEYNQ